MKNKIGFDELDHSELQELMSKILPEKSDNTPMRKVLQMEQLSEEELFNLHVLYSETKNPDTLQTIVLSHFRLGMWYYCHNAHRYKHALHLTPEWAFSLVYDGLKKAVEDFDLSLGYKFSTYAVYKLQNEFTFWAKTNNARGYIRPPYTLVKIAQCLSAVANAYQASTGNTFTVSEACLQHPAYSTKIKKKVAALKKISQSRLSAAYQLINQKSPLSLSAPVSGQSPSDHEQEVGDFIVSEQYTATDVETTDGELRILFEAFERLQGEQTLSDSEYVAFFVYVFGPRVPYQKIGDFLSISSERVRQLIVLAYVKLLKRLCLQAVHLFLFFEGFVQRLRSYLKTKTVVQFSDRLFTDEQICQLESALVLASDFFLGIVQDEISAAVNSASSEKQSEVMLKQRLKNACFQKMNGCDEVSVARIILEKIPATQHPRVNDIPKPVHAIEVLGRSYTENDAIVILCLLRCKAVERYTRTEHGEFRWRLFVLEPKTCFDAYIEAKDVRSLLSARRLPSGQEFCSLAALECVQSFKWFELFTRDGKTVGVFTQKGLEVLQHYQSLVPLVGKNGLDVKNFQPSKKMRSRPVKPKNKYKPFNQPRVQNSQPITTVEAGQVSNGVLEDPVLSLYRRLLQR